MSEFDDPHLVPCTFADAQRVPHYSVRHPSARRSALSSQDVLIWSCHSSTPPVRRVTTAGVATVLAGSVGAGAGGTNGTGPGKFTATRGLSLLLLVYAFVTCYLAAQPRGLPHRVASVWTRRTTCTSQRYNAGSNQYHAASVPTRRFLALVARRSHGAEDHHRCSG